MKKTKLLLLAGLSFCLTGCSLLGTQNGNINVSDEMYYISQIYEYLQIAYYKNVDLRSILDGMVYGITSAYDDPYTYYTSSANGEYQDYSSSGVGLGFSRTMYYGEAYLDQVMKNSPAEKAGLKDGDIIYKTRNINSDGTYQEFYVLKDHSSSDWGNAFTGEVNTQIEVYIRRKDSNGVYVQLEEPLVATRGTYNVDKTRLMEITSVNGYSEAYIQLTSFLGDEDNGETTPYQELKDIFDNDIFTNGIDTLDHLILDLRGNGGGYVDNCTDALGLFIPQGQPTAYYLFKDGSYSALVNTKVTKQYTSQIEQITLIIDSETASAAETFVMGLRDSEYTKDKVNVVGRTSYGKGCAQTFLSLFGDGSLIRYTFAQVCSPSKAIINQRGIVPEVFLGEEHISYEKYVKFIPGVTDNNLLSEDDKTIILNRINELLGTTYSDFEEAVTICKKALKITENSNILSSVYTQKFADELHDNVYIYVVLNKIQNIYVGNISPKENNDYLSIAQRIFIRDKINLVLNSSYASFDKALKAFQEKYNIVNEEGIYDKSTADLLQGLSMDIHFDIYNNQVIEQVKELYGSKKI
jgi:carboxyl-terminal processing protease